MKKPTDNKNMTKIKLCGLSRPEDIDIANELLPDYIGFVFFPKSRRYIEPALAFRLKQLLHPSIQAVGVFVNEDPSVIANYLEKGIIDVAQLHGKETESELQRLRSLTDKPVFQAFRIETEEDIKKAEASSADRILLDSGSGGTGTVFDWSLSRNIRRPYFLAGGLGIENAAEALQQLHPYGVDISSGIETEGKKDKRKMAEFVKIVRTFDRSSQTERKSL